MQSARQRTVLIHYGEIGLKGRNQPIFRRQLQTNLRIKLKSLGINWPVQMKPGFLSVPVPADASDSEVQKCLAALNEVFGVAWCALTEPLPHHCFRGPSQAEDFANLETALVNLANSECSPNKTFCVRVKRSEKSVPFTSPELETRLGKVLVDRSQWKRVNLDEPDALFQVEIRREGSFLFSNKLKGPGGLPVGTAGRVLVFLSGGIDSPAAAYLMAKRGCRVDYLHFTATSMQQDEAQQYKVWRLAKHLSRYTLGGRLFLVPYTQYDVAALASGQQIDYDLVMFRRFMARTGEALAQKLGAQALASGDNLSQVASQTLSNLVSTSHATEMPILRPLIGFDKEEIIDLSKKIGTYETSIEPYKDCCAIIAQNPRTKSNAAYLEKLERRVFPDYAKLIENTLAEAISFEFEPGQ
jgi:thiamine biosynthesis protein ThiI